MFDPFPDLYRVPATDADGTPWVLWTERNRLMCPPHGHLLQEEMAIAATHEPLF